MCQCTDNLSMKSRHLVKTITRLWTKQTQKAVFTAVYGLHPPLYYQATTSNATAQEPSGPPSAQVVVPPIRYEPDLGTPTTNEPVPGVPTSEPVPGVPTNEPVPGVATSEPVLEVPATEAAPGVPTNGPFPGIPTHVPAPRTPTTATFDSDLAMATSTIAVISTVMSAPATAPTRATIQVNTSTSPATATPQAGSRPQSGKSTSSLRTIGFSARTGTTSPGTIGSSAGTGKTSSRPVSSPRRSPPQPEANSALPRDRRGTIRRRQRAGPEDTSTNQTVGTTESTHQTPAASARTWPETVHAREKRKRVEEPPPDLTDWHAHGHNSPQAQSQVWDPLTGRLRLWKRHRTNPGPSTTGNASDETPGPSALDQVELDLIQYPEGVQTSSTVNLSLNTFLLQDFTKPGILIRALKLLSGVSSGAASPSVDLTTIPLALEVQGNHLVPNLIAAACRANKYLQELEVNIAAAKLKTIMSYVILYLTLEHAIVPQLRRENPGSQRRWIDGMKYLHFADILKSSGSTDSSPEISGVSLRNYTNYGRCFWEYGQSLGIASFLVFAVSDVGLTRIGGASRAGIPHIAAALTTDDTWWAFAHAISPPTFRTLFGACDIAYSLPQLLSRIRQEPVPPSTITAINEEYSPPEFEVSADHWQAATEACEEENWQIVIGGETLPIQRHPSELTSPVSKNVVRRNLGNWLKNTDGDSIVEDSRGSKTPFRAFKSLLPPSNIANELVDFLTNVFNAKAVPGRVALPLTHPALAAGSFEGTFEEFLQGLTTTQTGLAGARPERVLCPFDTEEATIGIVISATKSTMIAYNWLRDHTLAEGIINVFY